MVVVVVVVVVERGGDGNCGGVEVFYGGERGFDDVVDVLEFGGFVYVIVELFVVDREVEFLDKKCEVRVRGF